MTIATGTRLGSYEITALLGAIWGAIYLTRRSIVAPMVSHAGFNLGQVVKYFLIPR